MRLTLFLLLSVVGVTYAVLSEWTEDADVLDNAGDGTRFMRQSAVEELEGDLSDDYEPLQIPRLSKEDKWEMIRESGQDPTIRRRHGRKRVQKVRRALVLAPWRITHVLKAGPPPVQRPTTVPIALSIDNCPNNFDAVTRGYNGRTYVFARDRVYQIWYENNLPNKASYSINELFPGGPRQVSAAMTNSRSGVTVLFDKRTAYRFRWNKKAKRFHLARNRSPQEFPQNITITPTVAFEWMDGNQVMVEGKKFVTYDAYWNLPTFSGETKRYFPNIPRDIVGIAYNGGETALMYTKSNKLKVYHTKKFRVVQEYPIKINEYIGCI